MILPSNITRCPFPCERFPSIIPKLLYRKFLQEVVIHVVKARFFTKPHPYPSGVSQGQIMPQ